MKKTALIAALALCAALLAGCGGDGGTSDSGYRDDVPVSDLVSAVDGAIDAAGLVAVEDSYLENSMQLDPAAFAEYAVKVNAQGANIDEYGIFAAADEDSVGDVQSAAEGYLQLRLDNWMPEYMPEELPKLENAEVRICGRYVMYAILSDEGRAAAFEAFEGALSK